MLYIGLIRLLNVPKQQQSTTYFDPWVRFFRFYFHMRLLQVSQYRLHYDFISQLKSGSAKYSWLMPDYIYMMLEHLRCMSIANFIGIFGE